MQTLRDAKKLTRQKKLSSLTFAQYSKEALVFPETGQNSNRINQNKSGWESFFFPRFKASMGFVKPRTAQALSAATRPCGVRSM